jgi:hypothetical protein
MLFDLSPQTIPLPRTLCLYHYKSTDFHNQSVISNWDYQNSLRAAGFPREEINRLNNWLSTTENQRIIKDITPNEFVTTLKKYGVSIHPQLREPDKWHGQIQLN